jgi:uncharacterized protein (TIGR04222 family)
VVNPLDLRGPQFLVFYFVFGVTVLGVLALLRRQSDSSSGAALTGLLTNYLDIAFLRGGPGEALRVALLGLVKRGLLIAEGDKVYARDPNAIRAAQTGTERGLLEKFAAARTASYVIFDRGLRKTVREACEPTLVRLGLLPDAETRAARRTLFLWAFVILGGVAAAKIFVALSRGRTNIGLLIVLGLVFLVFAYRVTHPRRTSAGDSMLDDLERLFDGLKGRAATNAQAADDNELSLLAAVFGMSVLYTSMPDARRLFAPSNSSTGCGSSSSCGSSSGCGSGGGGGGCGGGGGGCGGCGS